MARIEEWQCFMMDMEWYGTDKKGNIAVFCSAGEGYLPEFVCEDRDRADLLIDFFEKYQKYTQSVVLHKMTDFATQASFTTGWLNTVYLAVYIKTAQDFILILCSLLHIPATHVFLYKYLLYIF